MKSIIVTLRAIVMALCLALLCVTTASGESQSVVTLTLAPDQIATVRTAPGITTRLSFPETVIEVICGDLYDATTGKGSFVIQRSGTPDKPGSDVYLKPVAAKGLSNLFVKIGDGSRTFNFDLTIVSPAEAHRVVNVSESAASQQAGRNRSDPATDGERQKQLDQQMKDRANEILRNARQQADRVLGEAESKAAEVLSKAREQADEETGRRFMQSMMIGIREIKIDNPRSNNKTVAVVIDPARVLIFNERAYLRYVISNTGKKELAFKTVILESGTGAEAQPVTSDFTHSKPENVLAPGESLTGIMTFDPKQITPRQRLTLRLQANDDTEIIRVAVQQP